MQATDTTRLREIARPQRPTLRRVAEEAGVSYSLVLKVAAGTRRPNAAVRQAVEDLFGVPAHFVFGETKARPRRLQ